MKFLDVNEFSKKLRPVTVTEYFNKVGKFHDSGLFSELIFGAIESKERDFIFSFINLNCKVIHPTALKILLRLDRKIEKFINTESNFFVTETGELIEGEDGVTGISNFIKLFDKIKFRIDSEDRKKLADLIIDSNKKGLIFIDKIPVVPPRFRPIFQDDDGNWILDKLNDVYIGVLRRSIQIKSTGNSGPLYDLLNYGVQKAVIEHDTFIRTKVEKKSGLIRSSMLSKRIDYSGRAVIIGNPNLKYSEVGVPMRIAVLIFEPFLIHILFTKFDKKELEKSITDFTKMPLSVDSVQKIIKMIKNGDTIPDDLYAIFVDATRLAMENRYVLTKRDPALHAENVRGMKPILTFGNAMEINDLQIGGFAGDFDGDQMAIYHPLTDEAQAEVKLKMTRTESPTSFKSLTFDISKEMCLGLYILSKDKKLKKSEINVNEKDLQEAVNPEIPVNYRGRKTTMGRAILNNCLPSDFPFVDVPVNKKVINKILSEINLKYGGEISAECANKLKNVGFKFATISGAGITLDDLELPKEVYELKKKLVGANTEEALDIINKARKIVVDHLEGTGLYDFSQSGGSRGWDQVMQILIAKGIISDPSGKILPVITSSISDGLSDREYFQASAGGKKGIIDRVHNTAKSGYMSRKLAYVLNSVEADLYEKDCKTERYLTLKLDNDIMSKMTGRYISKGGSIQEFKANNFKVDDIVKIRTPIYCQTEKICHTCYGRLLEKHKSPYIGIVSAQVIGEVGTQLVMRTFHTGGAVKLSKRNIIGDILENDITLTSELLKGYLKQEDNYLIVLQKCKLLIDISDFSKEEYLNESDSDVIFMKSVSSKLIFDSFSFNLIIDYPVSIHKSDVKFENDDQIEIDYDDGDTLLETNLEKSDITESVRYVEKLITGRENFTDVEHLFRKFAKVYMPISSMDIIHYEVLLSQCLRYKKDITIPARLGKEWDPVMVNLRKLVFNSGILQGIAFENLNGAIETMLTNKKQMPQSVLEKLLTGKLVEVKKHY